MQSAQIIKFPVKRLSVKSRDFYSAAEKKNRMPDGDEVIANWAEFELKFGGKSTDEMIRLLPVYIKESIRGE